MNPGIILLLLLVTYCVIGWFVGTIFYVFMKMNTTKDAWTIAALWPFYLVFYLISVTIVPITKYWINFLKSLKKN